MCCGRFISVSLREAGTVSIDISEFVSLVNRKKKNKLSFNVWITFLL